MLLVDRETSGEAAAERQPDEVDVAVQPELVEERAVVEDEVAEVAKPSISPDSAKPG